jgi:hypothetical protein
MSFYAYHSGGGGADGVSSVCARSIGSSVLGANETLIGTFSRGLGSTSVFTSGYQVHPAWTVQWMATDAPKLTPTPPELAPNIYIPTWVPGEQINPADYDTTKYTSATSLMLFLCIGIPLLIITFTAISIWLLCCMRRSPLAKFQVPPKPESPRESADATRLEGIELPSRPQELRLQNDEAEQGHPPRYSDDHNGSTPMYSPIAAESEMNLPAPTTPQPPTNEQARTIS